MMIFLDFHYVYNYYRKKSQEEKLVKNVIRLYCNHECNQDVLV